jgi:hypothetical protein
VTHAHTVIDVTAAQATVLRARFVHVPADSGDRRGAVRVPCALPTMVHANRASLMQALRVRTPIICTFHARTPRAQAGGVHEHAADRIAGALALLPKVACAVAPLVLTISQIRVRARLSADESGALLALSPTPAHALVRVPVGCVRARFARVVVADVCSQRVGDDAR